MGKYTTVPVKVVFREGKREFKVEDDGQSTLYVDPIWSRNKEELRRTVLMRAVDEYLSPLPDDVYIRVSNKDSDYDHLVSGTHKGSTNHATGEKEYGLSVSKHPEFPAKNAYYVQGEKIADGSDGEPVLDINTVKVLSEKMTHKKLVSDFDRKQKKHIKFLGLSPESVRALQSSKTLVFD